MDILAFNMLISIVVPKEVSLLIDIFEYKNINQAIDFNCNTPETSIAAQKIFFNHQIRMASFGNKFNTSFPIQMSYHYLGMILNTSCENWSSNFDVVSTTAYTFKKPLIWFIITKDVSLTLDNLSQFPIEVDSDVTIIYKTSEKFVFYEVYNTGFYNHGKIHCKEYGYWDGKSYMKSLKRMDLSGVTLKSPVVVTNKVSNETFEQYVERSRLSKSDTLHKLKYFTLLKYLRDMYNFSYELQRTSSWGYLRNGSFDGMIGALQRGEADIGGSPIFFRLERALVVSSTVEVWKSTPMFVLRHPKHPGGYYTIFTRPLTTTVWYCMIAMLTVSGIMLNIFVKLKVLKAPADHEDASPSLVFLTIWSAICQQGAGLTRESSAVKLVIFVTFTFTLTIFQYYNATVVSTLLREPPKNIRTPQDLLRSNLKAGVHDVLYNKDFFKRTTDPIALEMYHKKISTQTEYNFFTLEYGMSLVQRGGFAFLVDTSIAYGIMKNAFNEQQLCDAHEIALYPPQNLVAIVKKGSPYRKHFSYGLRKMFESGLMKRIKSIWDVPRPACVRTPDTSLISVSIREFSMALILLLCGMILAVIVLLWEIIVHSSNKGNGSVKLRNKIVFEFRN